MIGKKRVGYVWNMRLLLAAYVNLCDLYKCIDLLDPTIAECLCWCLSDILLY